MDEFDDLTDEERRLAAEFAQFLEDGESQTESDQIRSLRGTIAFVETSERWELDSKAQERGRQEVEELAEATRRTPVSRSPKKARWFLWLPLPALAVLALVVQLTPDREGPHLAESAPPTSPAEVVPGEAEQGFEKLAPRYHAGEIPPKLLEAQAALLSERAPGVAQEEAKQAFEREMRTYRGQLIASLEVGGR